MSGILYVVATPIGNLADITYRAVETLKASDVIACEDTRQTGKLLRHFGIQKPTVRYDEHTHQKSSERIIRALHEGKTMSLVSDAGTPTISDPGSRLVDEALEQGIRVVPIPGPSSPIAALSASGFKGQEFVFLGFLPRRKGRLKRLLQEALGLGKTVVFMESPYRLESTMNLVREVTPESRVAVARELTKIHEEITRGTVKDGQEKSKPSVYKGEIIVLIEPSK